MGHQSSTSESMQEVPMSMMDDDTARRLVALNARFYDQLAEPFAASRATPQPGYEQLAGYLPPLKVMDVLDVGCGNGRFGRYLLDLGRETRYTGVDFSARLMATGGDIPGDRRRRDLSLPDALAGLGDYDLIACLSTLQHIPGRANRRRLLREMGEHLRPDGRLILANWQFLDSPRQRRKLRPWPEAGFTDEQVEPGDWLLSWERGGAGLRYVALIDEAAMRDLAEYAGLRPVDLFRSDGREGDLNLYAVMAKNG